MILENLTLFNFRNYEKLNLILAPKINIFFGNNAQGKTNILESIYVLALTKSHRALIENDLIKFEESIARISGVIENQGLKEKLEITLSNSKKSVKINKKEIKKLSEYVSRLNVIIFTPDDLELIKGSPSIRRRFLNIEIGQVENKYLNILNEYNVLLKTRNEYLKTIYINSLGDDNYLDILTEKLIELASKIYIYRYNFINDLNNSIGDIYEKITDSLEFKILYQTNPNFDKFEEELIKAKLREEFKKNKHREINYGNTIIGPHRDDFLFLLEDKELRIYGSQGQQRGAVLSLKLAEIDIFYKRRENYPIVLLDDVLSEFDEGKKNNLLHYINKDIQTIITTTNLKNIDSNLLKEAYIYFVNNGCVLKIDEVKKDE